VAFADPTFLSQGLAGSGRRLTRSRAAILPNDGAPLPSASAAPEPVLEVEDLGDGVQPEPSQGFRRQQRAWWQAAQSTLAKSPSKIRCGCRDGAAWPKTALGDDPLAQKTWIFSMAIVALRTNNAGKRLGHCCASVMRLLDAISHLLA